MNETSCQGVAGLERLLKIIRKLRSEDGCPWDRQQKKEDMAKYILEETYELIDAINNGSPDAMKEEMGDLLFQVFFLASISEEAGEVDIAEVMKDVTDKMIRRHPHVFGNVEVKDIDQVKINWLEIKKNIEKRNEDSGLFDGIPRSMPALKRAQKVTEKASAVGFDWGRKEEVIEKIEEELNEFKSSLATSDTNCINEEIGDLLLSLVNLSRFVNVDAEESLSASLAKFINRFSFIEQKLAEKGKDTLSASLEEMNCLWNESKLKESSS